MNVAIIEDEINAYEYLATTLRRIDPSIHIDAHHDSIYGTLTYLSTQPKLDLIFLDIQLADGMSFEIFSHVDVEVPIIFTTAYDQYAVDAFKLHSVDYLLKPIHSDELRSALDKYHRHYEGKKEGGPDLSGVLDALKDLRRTVKKRCLVRRGNHFEYVDVQDVVLIYSEDSITFLHTRDGSRYIYNRTIDRISQELDPDQFFQINRSQIINHRYISKIHPYLNQRLKLALQPEHDVDLDLVVARGRVSTFKEWIDQ
ncbi:MAG: LytTR family DNA-binding domain-containing protein [Bacteroidota bacterium]